MQQQAIEKALAAIDECRSEEKDITSMTMDNGDRYQENRPSSQVYQLAIQLYPVLKPKDQE